MVGARVGPGGRGTILGAALACALFTAAPAASQSVVAHVVNGEGGAPVVGALVYLLDERGELVRNALTNDRGRVLFLPAAAGRYRLRAEMIGMGTVETEPFPAAGDETLVREIVLTPRPIELEGVSVEAEERCRVSPREGLLTAQLWDEARKALTAAEFTEREQLYTYATTVYERDLERDARTITREEQSHRRGMMRSPFVSRPAEDLVENGFAQVEGGDTYYYGPDAGVLLSDAFLDTHCFGLRQGRERDGTAELVGLGFEPIRDQVGRVDVTGTLWLDPGSAELRWLEYRYANLPEDIASSEIGGRVEFQRMPEGGWIVPRWWIRMPAVGVQSDVLGRRSRYLVGFRESGGIVREVREAGGRRVAAGASTGGIEGTVVDSLGAPRAGVIVRVVGSNQTVFTNEEGRFGITGLVEGTYQVRFVDPRMESYGFLAEPVPVEVVSGELADIEYRVPSAGVVLAGICRGVETLGPELDHPPPQAEGDGIVLGWVRDAATGEPLPGAVVRVLSYRNELVEGRGAARNTYDKPPTGVQQPLLHQGVYGYETAADEDGFYRFCRVPERELLVLVAVHGGVETRADTLFVPEVGGIVEHTLRVSREPPPPPR